MGGDQNKANVVEKKVPVTKAKVTYRITDDCPEKFHHRGTTYFRDKLTQEQIDALGRDKKFQHAVETAE